MNKELEDYIEGNKPCVNDSHINKNWKEGAKWALSDPKAIEIAGLVKYDNFFQEALKIQGEMLRQTEKEQFADRLRQSGIIAKLSLTIQQLQSRIREFEWLFDKASKDAFYAEKTITQLQEENNRLKEQIQDLGNQL